MTVGRHGLHLTIEGEARKMPQIQPQRVESNVWRIPRGSKPGMNVPCIIYANQGLISKMMQDRTLIQGTNVATLQGIYKHSVVLPDGHEGYGFPIGGVAAMDAETGVISPGGVGYDINCGVRLLTSDMEADSLKPVIPELLSAIFNNVPCGLGSRRRDLAISPSDLDILTSEGVRYVIEKHGLGWEQDIEHCEEKGCMKNADPSKVSPVAKRRGEKQVGTLGSGNHFLEIQRVDKIFDDNAASAFGIRNEGQVMVMIHTGSRGFGHQICSDYLKTMERAVYKYRLSVPDRELACAPADSEEAQAYYDAMACAVNYAFSNRQAITQWVRQSFERVVRQSAEDLGLNLVYDVAHNIAKLEDHQVNGEKRGVYVHRKGATRSFPAGSPDLPQDYREVGQPVLIPGSMGTSSWVMLGTPRALQLTWGSTAHGAGRVLSRSSAKRRFRGSEIKSGLRSKGIFVREASLTVLVEEADAAYKNVDEVAQISHDVGIATKVARLTPLGVVKG